MLDAPRTLPIRFLLAGAFTAWIPSVSAFKDGEDFSNNLFSDLAPVLSLFGEQVAKQFMAGSMGWADNILFAMVPLGIITAIVSAIRIGGPGWLKAVIGRARENQTSAEMELTTSTSAEVCELWNGRAVVRMIGAPKILELLCFFSESTNTSGCNHDLFTLPTAVHDRRIKGKLQNHWGTSFIAPVHLGIRKHFTSPASSTINSKTSDVEASPISNIFLERSSKSTYHGSVSQVESVTVPELYAPKSSRHGGMRVAVNNLPVKARSAPNISVNLVKRNSLELICFAALGILVQLGVIVFSAYATYDRSFGNRIGGTENHGYGFPLNAIGTVVLAIGMIICAFVVESSTRETRWELVDEKRHGKFTLLWLQRGENVNDQVFDSYVIFGSEKRNMVLSSVLATINTSHSDHYSRWPQKKSYQASSSLNPSNENRVSRKVASKLPTETLVIAGSVASISGFVVQFIGLRAMHWSASIAQLIGTLIMVGIRTFVRRNIAEPPHTQKLPHDHELDWLATRMGTDADKGKLWTTGNSIANGVEFWSEDCWEWCIITSSDTTDYRFRQSPKIHPEMIPCEGCTWPNKVVSIRSRLGSLSKWTTEVSNIAMELASAIEVVMNAVFATGVSEGSVWQWPLRGKEQDLIFLSVKYMNGHWSTNATDIESVLSLWIYASRGRHTSLKPYNSRELNVNEAESTDEESRDTLCYSTADQGDWIRSRGESLSPTNLSFLGPIKCKYLRDLSWYSKKGLSLLQEAQELEAHSIRETSTSGAPLESAAKNEKTHTSRGKHGTIIDVDTTRIVGFTCIDKETQRAAPPSTSVRRFRLSPLQESGLRFDSDTVDTPHNFDACEGASTNSSDSYSRLIVMKSEVPLPILYARDMFTTFMWAVATDMNPLCGKTTLHASVSDWRIFTLENTIITSIVKDIGKVASRCLGDPDAIYFIIIPPLSFREKLPIPSVILEHASAIGRNHESMNQWKEASEVYKWLFRECEMLPKELQHRSTALLIQLISSAELSVKSLTALQFEPSSPNPFWLSYERDMHRIKGVISSVTELLKKTDPAVLEALEILQFICHNPETDHLGNIKTYFAELQMFRDASRLHQDIIDGNLPELFVDDSRNKMLRILKDQKSEKNVRNRLNPLEVVTKITEKTLVGLTPLHYCSILGFTEGIKALLKIFESLQTPAADITHHSISRYKLLTDTDIFGRTPLHYSSAMGHEEIVQSLCAGSARVHASFTADVSGKTPIYYARNESIAWILLSFGDRLDTVDRDGASPLHWMAGRGMIDTVRLFLEAGAVVDCHDNRRLTPLHWAALGGHDGTVKLLIAKGSSTQSRDVYGRVPLHQAALAKTSTKEMLEHLLDGGTLVASDRNGFTAVHFAASAGNSVTLGYLAELGADVHVRAEEMFHLSPLHLAARKGHQNVIRKLISEYNAFVDVKDREERTPLCWAAYEGQHETVKTLFSDYNGVIDIVYVDGRTPLHVASQGGHEDTVRMLLECNADVDAVDKDNWTPLHFAASKDYSDIARLLIKEGGANMEAKDKDFYTALHHAASGGYSDTVRTLIRECGANVEAKGKDGYTALHKAMFEGHSDTVRTLIREFGANVEAESTEKMTPLHYAAADGHYDMAKFFIQECGANVHALDMGNWTPLHNAAFVGRSDIARLLIQGGANVESTTLTQRRWAPLHFATYQGHIDTVRMLVQEFGANVEALGKYGWTALHLGAMMGYSDLVRQLCLELNANVEAAAKDGRTPIHLATVHGHHETVRVLSLELNSNVEAVDKNGKKAIHLAARAGHHETVRMLLQECKVKVGSLSETSGTPLHCAAWAGDSETIRMLIQEFNADVSIVFKRHGTPLHCAAYMGHSEIVRILVQECNADVQSSMGFDTFTPLHLAALYGHKETVRVLLKDCKAKVDAVSSGGATPLHLAVHGGFTETVRILVSEGYAAVNLKDGNGHTALAQALDAGKKKTVRALLKLGATYDGDEPSYLIHTDSRSQLDSSSIDLSQTIFAFETDDY